MISDLVDPWVAKTKLIFVRYEGLCCFHACCLTLGISHRPCINFRTSSIIFESPNPQSWMPFVQNIRTFIYLYEEVNLQPQDGFASCEEGVKSPNDPKLVCKFFPELLSPCVKEGNYGYDRGEPCVILKMNKVL